MTKHILAALLCITSSKVYAQAPDISNDPELQGLEWHVGTTENFEIICLGRKGGEDRNFEILKSNLEMIKTWIFRRWSLEDVNFSTKCRVVFVPSQQMFEKLFFRDEITHEFEKDGNRLKKSIVWFWADGRDWVMSSAPEALTPVCLKEWEVQNDTQVGEWAIRGMPVLNKKLSGIRDQLLLVNKNNLISVQDILEQQKDAEDSPGYAVHCAYFCLLVRKELGKDRFLNFLREFRITGVENTIQRVLGYRDYLELNRKYHSYIMDLQFDIREGRTPDSYLNVNSY